MATISAAPVHRKIRMHDETSWKNKGDKYVSRRSRLGKQEVSKDRYSFSKQSYHIVI